MKSKLKQVARSVVFSSPFRNFIAWSRRFALPGFDGTPVYYVADFFFTGLHKGSLNTRATALAFSFLMALFPSVIFLFSLIPFVPIPNFQDQLLDLIRNVLPDNAYRATRTTIEDIVKHQHGGLLSFGFFFALYFTTNGFMALMNGFNSSYHATERRSVWKRRQVAFVLTFIMSFLLILATLLIVFSEIAIRFLTREHIIRNKTQVILLLAGKWVVVLAVFFLAISFLYYYGPSVKKRWRFVSAGSTFASLLSIGTSLGFAFFVNNFGRYNTIYGSIGTLIVIMLWIYFNSYILLLGFELNASIDNARKHQLNKLEL
jgi:membrane protein